LNLNGFKLFCKNLVNSPKIFFNMIFNTVNLYSLTCIPKFDVPLQVAKMTYK
jgi:hypothetical protein